MSGFPIFGRTIYFGAVKFIVGKRLHKSFRVTSVAVGITASGVSAGESEFPDLGREIDVSPEASIGVGICTYTTYDTVGSRRETVMMLMIPPTPSASYLEEGFVITSIFLIVLAGILLRTSLTLSPDITAELFPLTNTL